LASLTLGKGGKPILSLKIAKAFSAGVALN
jgi:hypothetical protein